VGKPPNKRRGNTGKFRISSTGGLKRLGKATKGMFRTVKRLRREGEGRPERIRSPYIKKEKSGEYETP